MPTVLVTGGLGFIGAEYVNHLFNSLSAPWGVAVLDARGYAADAERLAPGVRAAVPVIQCNLSSWSRMLQEFARLDVRQVVHFAAYSHVSASFLNPLEFSADNLLGTHTLLECCRLHGGMQRVIVISTDEVYGESAAGPEARPFTEESGLNPSNPYAASKAAADLLALSYAKCFKLPVIVTRGNNVIGPRQHREKLLPSVISQLRAGRQVGVEGDGRQLRSFLFVEDAARGIEVVRVSGEVGQVYNVGGDSEHSVLDVVQAALDVLRPSERWQDWNEYWRLLALLASLGRRQRRSPVPSRSRMTRPSPSWEL